MGNVIILGDPHIGKGTSFGKSGVGPNLNSRIIDQLNLLDWTLDQAIENNSSNIIITGDVFDDPKPPSSLIALFMSWINKCKIHNIGVTIIIGNHDILRSGNISNSSLDIITEAEINNVNVYKNINTIYYGTTAFTFLPFKDRKSLNCSINSDAISIIKDSLIYELASIPVTYQKVLIGHLAIEGSIPVGDEIDDMNNELFCPIDMFKGYDYVWMGHVHKPQVMNKNPYIAHVGSMDISNFGEADQKKSIIIFDYDTGEFTKEYLPTRSLKKISISIPKDVNNTTEYVIEEVNKLGDVFDKSIVKIDVSLSSDDLKSINKSEIEKLLTSKGAFNVASIVESKKVSMIKREDNLLDLLDTKVDVVSAIKIFSSHIEELNRSKFIELATEIYNEYKEN